MKSKGLILGILGALILAALIFSSRPAEQSSPAPAPAQPPRAATPAPVASEPAAAAPVVADGKPVPHFHERLEDALPLPKILPASNFRIPVVARAYAIAARIPEVLAQQPCYCWCDKMGHGSLVDCFATDHGAGWAVCVKEVLLADQLTRAGLKPAEIRAAIMRGDWERVRLND